MTGTHLLPLSVDDRASSCEMDEGDVSLVLAKLHRRRSRRRTMLLLFGGGCLFFLFLLLTRNRGDDAEASKSGQSHLDDGEEPEWLISARAFAKTRSSVYTEADFTPAALAKNGLRPVSAVLLSWKRLRSLQFIVEFILRYPFVREIIVWNNNPDVVVSLDHFNQGRLNASSAILRVYNSAANVQDMAKYTTCSALANYDTCYIQDDDWLPTHFDTLYSSYVRDPVRVHTNTMPMIHIEHRRWTFTDPTVGMHSGFAWLGCGSFVPRSLTREYLQHVGISDLNREQTTTADIYFAIFTNRYVVQYINKLQSLDQQHAWSERPDQWNVVYTTMLDAARHLHKGLSDGSWDKVSLDASDDRDIAPNEAELFLERNLRAPCWNDRCIFLTNMDPFPVPSVVRFDPTVASIDAHQQKFYEIGYPPNKFWEVSSYDHAVDQAADTCWKTYTAPKTGDYFGLFFLQPIAFRHITLHMPKAFISQHQDVRVGASTDGKKWAHCQSPGVLESSDLGAGSSRLRFQISADCTGVAATISWVRVELAIDASEPWELCGMDVNGNEMHL